MQRDPQKRPEHMKREMRAKQFWVFCLSEVTLKPVCKRAVYLRNKDLYFCKTALPSAKEPYISANEPCIISAKGPYISAKEPCISSKQPYLALYLRLRALFCSVYMYCVHVCVCTPTMWESMINISYPSHVSHAHACVRARALSLSLSVSLCVAECVHKKRAQFE